jgi:hypothetical protein
VKISVFVLPVISLGVKTKRVPKALSQQPPIKFQETQKYKPEAGRIFAARHSGTP